MTFHFHALEKEMATHSSVLAWRTPGMGEPGGLPSMGSHRVGHDWSDLAAAAAASCTTRLEKEKAEDYIPNIKYSIIYIKHNQNKNWRKKTQYKYAKFEYPKLDLAPTFMGERPNGVCSWNWFTFATHTPCVAERDLKM